MYRIAIVLFYIAACIKWGNWRKWKDYYSTILFTIVGDLTYNFIFHDYSLWKYANLINHTASSYMYILLVYPCAINLYLTYFPHGRIKGALYVLGWTSFNSLLEFVSFRLGYFVYENGWNCVWSIGFFFIGFLLIKLHYHHPILAWLVAGSLLIGAIFAFGLPFERIK